MAQNSKPPVLRSRAGRPFGPDCPNHQTRFIPLSYSADDSHASALRLIAELRTSWEDEPANVSFVRCTDGITNTLLKATNSPPGKSPAQVESDAILLRAYGHGTDVIIDRQREAQNHELLAKFGLAPLLLARFKNGMLYRYIQGTVTKPDDLRRPEIYCAVARRLAQWHSNVPCLPESTANTGGTAAADGVPAQVDKDHVQRAVARLATHKPSPNLWTVAQKWILALPTETEAQRVRQATLQQELERLVSELGQREGLGENGLVFAHCDLLSGNIIILPKADKNGVNGAGADNTESVAFIDYEYATPSPAAFDIANHFAEWVGFDCNYSALPTRAQRRHFIAEYIKTYHELLPDQLLTKSTPPSVEELRDEARKLFDEVDLFRGIPGFFWGIWGLIQATISDIDFDYASYAENRLGEYWAWREEMDGTRAAEGKEIPLRERRWHEEGQ